MSLQMLDRCHAWGLVAVVAACALSTVAAAQTREKPNAPASRAVKSVEPSGAESVKPKPRAGRPRRAAQQPEPPEPMKTSQVQSLRSSPGGDVGSLVSGIRGVLTVGFVGTGLVGIGLGHGFGGMAGVAGLAVQVALVGLLLWLFMWAFRRNGEGGFVLARSSRALPRERLRPAPRLDPMQTPRLKNPVERPPAGPVVGGPLSRSSLDIYQEDLDEFEWLLNVVQSAYAREDLDALDGRVTPRIHSYLAEALAVNASRGLISRIYDVRLLNVTISEAVADVDWDFARAALRFEARDVTMDRISGDVVRGDPQTRTEINEVWTFKRPLHGQDAGQWVVAGIRPV